MAHNPKIMAGIAKQVYKLSEEDSEGKLHSSTMIRTRLNTSSCFLLEPFLTFLQTSKSCLRHQKHTRLSQLTSSVQKQLRMKEASSAAPSTSRRISPLSHLKVISSSLTFVGYFTTKIFHPNVSLEGEICVNTLKRDWDPKQWNIGAIFKVIRCLLIHPFAESSLNDEAGKMFMEDYEEYKRMAALMT